MDRWGPKLFAPASVLPDMVAADLHVHTTNSDGTLTLERIPGVARRHGIRGVAVTDHDRLHPGLPVPVTRRGGVTIIHGIELRVEAPTQRIDLLGYGVRRTDDIVALVERLQDDRQQRGQAIVECVEDRLDVSLDLDITPGFGRPHVARAVADATDLDYATVFERLIGEDGPCYVAREIPTVSEGIDVLERACGLVGLAHPLRYEDPESALEVCAELGAVERWYPYGREVDTDPVAAAIDRYNLVPTGGSDAHDTRLGGTGLDAAAFDRVRARLSLP